MGKFSIRHLVKFGEQEHLYRLLKYGEIYMKNIDFYRKCELSNPEHLRGDIYECFNNISQQNTIKFLDSDLEINNVTVYENNNTYTGYLFCMYAIFTDNENKDLDSRMLDFGEYAVIILNPKEFIYRIKEYCKANNLFPNCSPVSYFNENYHSGILHPFMKREKYSYQSEARIYIHSSNPQDYLCFNIGSIEDIAILNKIRT